VVLQGNVIVPARSEVDVPGRVVLRSLSGDVGWSIEPASVSTGVHVSRTIIPNDRLVAIPVRVLNVQKEPATLKEGTNFRAPVVIAATTAARQAAQFHYVWRDNYCSPDGHRLTPLPRYWR